MLKGRISESIDRVLLLTVTAFFSIAVAGYFSRDTPVIIASAVAGALSVTALITVLSARRKPATDTLAIKETMLQFHLKPFDFAYDTVYRAFCSRYKPYKLGMHILVNRVAVYTHITPAPLSLEKFCAVFANKPEGISRLIILTDAGAVVEVTKLAALLPDISVIVFNGGQTYKLLKALNGLPEITVKLKREKQSFKKFFAAALSPKACKRYLFTAALLIGSSFFMPSSIYYIIMAAVCIGLTILAKIDIFKRDCGQSI